MKKIVFLFGLVFLSITRLLSQAVYTPSIIPPSPQAAGLMKFSDVPVSPYTGSSSVTVPIYTIQARGVSVPVNVSYHTGGIKLKEESGYVGLGWALVTGGAISRSVMDKDDFYGTAYFNTTVPQLQGVPINDTALPGGIYTPIGGPPIYTDQRLGNYIHDLWCNDLVSFSSGLADYSQVFTTTGTSSYDLEPDIYSYAFPGHEGKFIITRDRRVILEKQENIRVQFESNGNSFTITDEQGNAYYFIDKAFAQPSDIATSPVSSWNLSKIITNQLDTILYTYATDPTPQYVAPEIYDTYIAYGDAANGFQRSNPSGISYGNELLQSIDFPEGQLQFSYDNNRSDLKGGKKLDAVKLYSKTGGSLVYQREFDFYYSYFCDDGASSDSLEIKRLRLDSVREVSGSTVIPPYSFAYNSPSPNAALYKHSLDIDHWGFYNAKVNGVLIPSMTVYFNPPSSRPSAPASIFTYSGANRDPDGTNMQIFSMTSVKYPTGGKSVFEYEPNDYDVLKSRNGPVDFLMPTVVVVQQSRASAKRGDTSGTIDLSRIYPSIAANSSQANLQVVVTFRASDYTGLQQAVASNEAQFSFSGKDANDVLYINSSLLSCGGNVCSYTYNIPIHGGNMNYTWDIWISPSAGNEFQDVRVLFQYDTVQLAGEPVGLNNEYSKTGGGLRIKSITDYSDGNSIAQKRRFDYNYYAPVAEVPDTLVMAG